MRTLILSLAMVTTLAIPGFGCETAELIESWCGNDSPPIILGRPVMQFDWATPDEHFRIHYDIIGDRAVFRPDEDVDPPDEVPDYVNRAADYLALAYDSLVFGLGFDPPPFDGDLGGDSKYDIYLTEYTGLTTPEYPTDQYPGRPAYTSYIQLGHDLRTFRYPIDPLPLLKVISAHELFHAIEFTYRAFSSDQTAWWFESCARWAEEKVFDDVNDVYYDIRFYLANSNRSLYRTAGHFIYGAWLVPQYFDQNYGSSFIKECWEHFADFDFSMDALRYAFFDRQIDPDLAYCRHVVWNYFTGVNYRFGFYNEGQDFPATVTEARTHSTYPVDWISEPLPLENVAESYIAFRRTGTAKGTLVIEYLNMTEDRHKVCIAIENPQNEVAFSIYEVDTGVPSRFVISDFTASDKVIMMPVWIYEGTPRAHQTSYSYQAQLDTAVTPVYVEDRPGDFALRAVYPNPFNNAVSISYQAPYDGKCLLNIFDVGGRHLFGEEISARAGLNNIAWNAPDGLASGILFYTIDFGAGRISGKMSLLK
ncbi:MAG: hypothetical protein A2W25_14475 [candidate division Zixibacteria bacterium RBG_16_53_22]|nr:MAG: hypothetical protein A2W25_14475 [candidate division Zixibacteria bacterium RBG_16_53_22]